MKVKTFRKPFSRLTILILVYLVIILALIAFFAIIRPHNTVKIKGVFIENPKELTDFHLLDTHKKPFTKEQLKGHWTMLFFGFTTCQLICPTTMSQLNKMYQILEKKLPEKELPHVVFISVDPDRDTTAKLNHFVKSFNPHFIGANANIQEIIALGNQLHIATAKIETNNRENLHYTINHSMDILLLNPEGRVQAYFSYPHQPEQLAKDYELIIRRN